MTNRLSHWGALLGMLMCICATAYAANPLEFFEVVNVSASRAIEHGVQSKSTFDNDKIETMLVGPLFFSHAIGSKDAALPKTKSYLNWYKIARAPEEPRKTVVVQDPLRGDETQSITIGSSAFLLSPAQKITTGPPTPIPAGLSYFKAYKILDAPLVSKPVKLSGTLGPDERTITRAVFLCVPVEEWHHDEYFPVKNPQDCFVVYESLSQRRNDSVSTIDQFGMNQLEPHLSSGWLGVRAKISQPKPADSK